mgnify:CR=1 FL=1
MIAGAYSTRKAAGMDIKPDEQPVYCKDCNGYLWSNDREPDKPESIIIPCPYMTSVGCQPRKRS